jgi:hypothetical protein
MSTNNRSRKKDPFDLSNSPVLEGPNNYLNWIGRVISVKNPAYGVAFAVAMAVAFGVA